MQAPNETSTSHRHVLSCIPHDVEVFCRGGLYPPGRMQCAPTIGSEPTCMEHTGSAGVWTAFVIHGTCSRIARIPGAEQIFIALEFEPISVAQCIACGALLTFNTLLG